MRLILLKANTAQQKVLITGTAGFIGFHLAKLLLAEGIRVQGYDGMTDYYDVTIKQRRHAMLLQNWCFWTFGGEGAPLRITIVICREMQGFNSKVVRFTDRWTKLGRRGMAPK